MITKRGRPVAQLVPPDALDRQAVDGAIARLRALRERHGSLSVEEILAFRDEGRR